MDLQIASKKTLVTGSTAGIGYAIAERLALEGAHVWVNGRTQERVDAALAKIRKAAPNAKIEGLAADLSTAKGASDAIRALPELDIVVNNLGIFEAKDFSAIEDSAWMHIFEANVMSGVRLARHYLPKMLKANSNGRIIFISSESGVQIPTEMIHYGVTKTAQIALARGLADLTVGSSVTVNSILVGPTKSEGVESFVSQLAKQNNVTPQQFEADFFKTARPTSLLKRFIAPDEVASAIAFVASPLAAAINGSPMRVDGGVLKSAF